jgi:hypothetical protein
MKGSATLLTLSLVVFSLGLARASNTSEPPDVTGNTYHVTVVSSFGTTFTDCFHFDVPAAGMLSIDGLGFPIPYKHGQLDAIGTQFKAVSPSASGFGIEFHGAETTALSLLNGEAVSEFGDTFVLSGPLTSPCTPSSAGAASPYAR